MTGRAIVNVSLSRITTNQELMEIMLDQSYPVEGEGMNFAVSMRYKDVIFVM